MSLSFYTKIKGLFILTTIPNCTYINCTFFNILLII